LLEPLLLEGITALPLRAAIARVEGLSAQKTQQNLAKTAEIAGVTFPGKRPGDKTKIKIRS